MESDRIRNEIRETRHDIDRKVDALRTRARDTTSRVSRTTATWMPVAAVAAGVVGMVAFWPRRARRPSARLATTCLPA